MKTLLYQLSIIQDTLQEYNIRNASIFGSRVYGTNNEFSDLDLYIDAIDMFQALRRNKTILSVVKSMHTTNDAFTLLIFDHIIDEAKRKVKLDISPLCVFSQEELKSYSSILKNKVDILQDGERVSQTDLKERLRKIRLKTPSFERKDYDVQYYLLVSLASLAGGTSRYYSYLKNKEEFFNPKSVELCFMRNDILHDISKFSFSIDKFANEEFVKDIRYVPLGIEIANVVKQKMRAKNNYNSSDLGWTVCSSEDLNSYEMELFWTFYVTIEKTVFNLLKNEELESIPEKKNARMLYEYSLEDKNGFLEATHRNHQVKTNKNDKAEKKLLYKFLLEQLGML